METIIILISVVVGTFYVTAIVYGLRALLKDCVPKEKIREVLKEIKEEINRSYGKGKKSIGKIGCYRRIKNLL